MATGINLKKFSGSENVHLWLSHLDSWQKFHNVTDGAALLAIGCSLEGQAETWLQTLSPRQRNNLTEFKECLKNRFAPQETNFTLLSIRQQAGETADVYLSRAEKTALGHDLPEIYKVQFAIQGLENQVKARVISKEPKTFQELRHAVSLAKAQLECNTTEDMNNLTLVALAAQLKDSLKAEISALTQSNCQSKNGQPEPWSKPPNPHPQWQQFAPPPPGYSVPVCQTNFAVPPTSYQQQPPVQPQVQPSAQQWPQATNNGPQVRQYQRASRVCKGCGIDKSSIQSTNATDAVAVGGEVHRSLGVLSLPISFDGFVFTHDFQVYDKFHQPLILGLDFLRANDAVLSIAQNTLSLKDPISNHVLAIDVNSGLARVCQTVTVNPGCVMAIEVFISSSLKGAHVLLEPSQQLPKLGLAGAKCLVDTLNNEIHYMQVINPTTDPITLSANTCIASATVVNPDTVLSLDNPKPSNTDSDPKPPQEETTHNHPRKLKNQRMSYPVLLQYPSFLLHLNTIKRLSSIKMKTVDLSNLNTKHNQTLKPYNDPDHRPSFDPPRQDEPIDDAHYPPDPVIPQPPDTPIDATHQPPETAPVQQTIQVQEEPKLPPTQTADNPAPHPQRLPAQCSSDSSVQTQDVSDKTYFVDKLLRYKFVKGKKLFRVKWLGYGERTWEPEENLPPCLVRKFHITKTQQGTPGLPPTLFLICLVSLLGVVPTGNAATYQRLNYGVLFEQQQQLYLGQEYWSHTFQIPLPKKVYLHRELYCNNAPHCKYGKHVIKTLNALRTQTMANLNATVHDIHMLIPQSFQDLNPSSAHLDLDPSATFLTL
uniref:Chromo domain-containing protein n=1 Tax=Magallana gigas TaxID=29159 RepID=A0A8W8N0V7_MAGGI